MVICARWLSEYAFPLEFCFEEIRITQVDTIGSTIFDKKPGDDDPLTANANISCPSCDLDFPIWGYVNAWISEVSAPKTWIAAGRLRYDLIS